VFLNSVVVVWGCGIHKARKGGNALQRYLLFGGAVGTDKPGSLLALICSVLPGGAIPQAVCDSVAFSLLIAIPDIL
jgi:hypothetical protein